VNAIWRSRDEMVFSVLPRDGKVLFSTRRQGRIYSLEGPKNTTLLLESTEEQTTRLSGSRQPLVCHLSKHRKAVSD
jgi:hypothetical protein